MAKLSKIIDRIQKVISSTGAKVTLEWPDGTKVFISRHVYAVRKPEQPKMEPMDDLKLHYFDELTEMTPEDWSMLKLRFAHAEDVAWNQAFDFTAKPSENRDKIQGDPNAPWITDDSKPA